MNRIRIKFNTLISTSLLAGLLCIAGNSYAETITQTIKPLNIEAEARYIKQDSDKPAILIIHGFLTTNQFHTVVAMAKGIEDEGYTTLAPTLTLDINKRKSSLKCNSIHTHTLEKDVIEIKDWVDWLKQQGHKKIILVGHSSGSQEVLEYLNTYHDKAVSGAIFTSLFYLKGKELGTLDNEIVFAEDLIAKKQNRPHKYSFLFCKNNYLATPESYLSYLKLDRNYVLKSLQNTTIPTFTIMGGADKRYLSVGKDWLTALDKSPTELIMVDGANHFFSSEHEFDLQDHLNEIISNLSTRQE
ncbi:alpha/beta hydrolase [Thiomicrorhabdus sp. Milos-T2]|uniref:alpha/beta hydrolase n=1 Tax=Thiomicrorhabdus sp. Milos-T2 TaxID=90814 RepID=UPI000494CDDF|nr:alpha/beta hydrolase [Thiomicrorhabdus sp. Milos-T2]